MICPKCSNTIDDNSVFCPVCGLKLPTQAQIDEPKTAESSTPVIPLPEERVVTGSPSYPMCHSTGDRPYMQQGGAAIQYRQGYDHPPRQAPVRRKKEKEFFGKGAFIFCLFIILLLAGTAGAFAFLYFRTIGMI